MEKQKIVESLQEIRLPLLVLGAAGVLSGYGTEALALTVALAIVHEMYRRNNSAKKEVALPEKFAKRKRSSHALSIASSAGLTRSSSLNSLDLSAPASLNVTDEEDDLDDVDDDDFSKELTKEVKKLVTNPQVQQQQQQPLAPSHSRFGGISHGFDFVPGSTDAAAQVSSEKETLEKPVAAAATPAATFSKEHLQMVEHYFSDDNLPNNHFVLSQAQRLSDGSYGIPVSVIAGFRKVREVGLTSAEIVDMMALSDKLVAIDGKFIRRQDNYLPTSVVKVDGLSSDMSRDDVYAMFKKYGRIRNLHLHDGAGSKNAIIRFYDSKEAKLAVDKETVLDDACYTVSLHRGTQNKRRQRDSQKATHTRFIPAAPQAFAPPILRPNYPVARESGPIKAF